MRFSHTILGAAAVAALLLISAASAAPTEVWSSETIGSISKNQRAFVCVTDLNDALWWKRPTYVINFRSLNDGYTRHATKYFFFCENSTNTVTLYQCGDHRMQDHAASRAEPISKCVVRETWSLDGQKNSSWKEGHLMIDRRASWTGKLYTMDWYLTRQWYGGSKYYYCSEGSAPTLSDHHPAGGTTGAVCYRDRKVITHTDSEGASQYGDAGITYTCGPKSDPVAEPYWSYYNDGNKGICAGTETKKKAAGNYSCAGCTGATSCGKLRGPRFSCHASSGHLAIVFDTLQSAGALSFVVVLFAALFSVMLF